MKPAGCKYLLPLLLLAFPFASSAQVLININFGGPPATPKSGAAAVGILTNDVWNAYRHYDPKFLSGMELVASGRLEKLKLHDGSDSGVSVTVTNAPGVWGNSNGDPMYDSYIFSQNGSNILVTLHGLPAGRYHFVLYGHADPDVSAEQNSTFALHCGTNSFAPQTPSGGTWKAGQPWVERAQYIVFRDVPVTDGTATINVSAGPGGIPVLNGLQILSRGTSPPRIAHTGPQPATSSNTNLIIRQISYDGSLSDSAARFDVTITVESLTTNQISAPLFMGEVALVSPEVPAGLQILSEQDQTRLVCSTQGVHQIKLQLLAKITRAEPWNTISIVGPEASIATVNAAAETQGVDLQLISGTQLPKAGSTNVPSRISGLLGSDRTLALRWQSKGAEVSRKSLLTVDTTATAEVAPTVVKFQTSLRYEILQAPAPKLEISIPAGHAITRIQGDQIRDWRIAPSEDAQQLTIDFIRPVEKSAVITLFSEQSLPQKPGSIALDVPKPLNLQRESGSLSIKTDDTLVEVESATGLRQVNAPAGAIAAYKFNTRPLSIVARVRRVEPDLRAADRITARVEETRLLVSHVIDLTVEKAGIYALELKPQPGFTVAEVQGEGIEEWKTTAENLNVTFKNRVLGTRKITVQMEKAERDFAEPIRILPLQIAGVTNTVTHVGAASSPGIRVKTDTLENLREIPANTLPDRKSELLAYVTEQPRWALTLTAEKLPPRVVSEVFNLITIGDGLVGGSATIRYGIVNQGIQQLRLTLPQHWRNIEFTGPMIRRKELASNVWTITLQDKAWGGYTLVVTYDYQFDPNGATLDLSGARTLDVERETGSLGIMTAATLRLAPAAPAEPLRRVDEAELSDSDRALCTRPLLLAYKYNGSSFKHSVQVTRFEELPVLEAVADRTELATVLTEEGQLLTQSSFMVKNNQKQFQRFKLPVDAELWSSSVNGKPAKPEKDGDWFLVPLPRDANRDQAFAVEIVYKQNIDLKKSLFPKTVKLVAPVTDIPNTYAEWQLFAPSTRKLGSFGGNMTVAAGTTYGLHDAWQQFLGFYGKLIENNLGALIAGFLLLLAIVLVIVAVRRGYKGALQVITVFAIMAILAGMLLPALSRAKARAQRINSMNNLKQIGLAAKTWAVDNGDIFPPSFESMMTELGTEKILSDPKTGQRYIYIGTGKSSDNLEAILAYSASDNGGREVLLADGSVQMMSQEKFDAAMQRDASVPRAVISGATVTAGPPGDSSAAGRPYFANKIELAAPPAPAQPAAPLSGSLGTFEVRKGTGGGGGFGVQPNSPTQAPAVAIAPTASGVRPIRIEIPRAGQAFSFTKVLNTGREPLQISASVIRLGVYRTFHMVLQVAMFVFGLGAFFILWITAPAQGRAARHALLMAVALALVIYSVGNLLIMWRILHLGFILVVPFLASLLLLWAGLKLWRKRAALKPLVAADTLQPPPEAGPAQPGTVIPVILLGLMLAAASGNPAQAEGASKSPDAKSGLSAVSILSAQYSGKINEKVGAFDGHITVSSTLTNQTIPFFGSDVAVQSFKASNNARLLRASEGLQLFLPDSGQAVIDVQFVVKTGGDVSKRRLAFSLPQALASSLDLLIEEPDAEIDFPAAVAVTRASTTGGTKIGAIVGPSRCCEILWTPRIKRAAEVAATVFVQNTALASIGAGVLNTRATLDYQVSQGELKQLQVRIPAGHRVLRVEGESLRVWEVAGDLLTVELLKSISPAYKLTVETEVLLEQFPAKLQVEIPHAVGVKRETGLVAYSAGEEISLEPVTTTGLQRVDAEEFQRAMPAHKEPVSAYRFLESAFALTLNADAVQPQVEAVVKQQNLIGPEAARITAQILYTIKRAGLFNLKVSIPVDYRIEGVAGQNIAQSKRNNADPSMFEVTLRERTSGSFSLGLVLVRNYKDAPAAFTVPAVHPLGASKLTGYITVLTEPGLAAKTASLGGLTEIPLGEAEAPSAEGLPGVQITTQAMGLGYKFTSTTPAPQSPWKLAVSTEPVEPWVRAEVLNNITVTETLISGRTLVKYEIVNAPTREFRIRVPAAFKNVDISGSQVRRSDQTNDEWRVELQGKVRGQYTLTVTWELPKTAETHKVNLPGIQALNVERETGFLAVIARPPLQASERGTTELLSRIDPREFPAWSGNPDPATVLAYRYLRPGYNLTLDVRRFAEAAVLQALIDSARLTTVVADDGSVLTEMALSIRNNGRQHLEIQLPKNSTVWSAFIGGESTRPNKRDGKLLLPLTRETASDEPISVELTFVGESAFPKHSGKVQLASPSFDIPMKNARWELYLPPDYEYTGFDGTMTKTSEAAAVPLVQVYSISEYNEQQRAQQAQQKIAVDKDLKAVREGLSGGNLRDAAANFFKAKNRSETVQSEGKDELKVAEQELRKAQSSNLINAQSQHFYRNAGRYVDGEFGIESAAAEQNRTWDWSEVAGLQWEKLEKAQHVVTAKVAPLRVNLPTRGVHLSFSQVLQTEVGKPMLVQMKAENTKAPSWFSRVVVSAVIFGAIWLILVIVNSRRHKQEQAMA